MKTAPPLIAVLLPGIDGTGRMFGPLIEQLPDWLEPLIIDYPTRDVLHYAALADYVRRRLPAHEPYLIVAESFAGPLALLVSQHAGSNLKALVLCATFVTNPRPQLAKLAPLLLQEAVLAMPPRKWMARLFVTGYAAPDAMLDKALRIHKLVAPQVTLQRLLDVIAVDVRELLLRCPLPLLHLYALRDRLILQRATREIQALRPDIQSIGIDGPHYLLQTRPQACVVALEKFLRVQRIVS